MSKQLEAEIAKAEERYKAEIVSGKLKADEIRQKFDVEDVNELAKLVKDEKLTLENIQDKVDEFVQSRGIAPKKISRPMEKQSLEESQEQEEPEEEAVEKAAEVGVSASLILMLAEKFECKPNQIDFRKIENYQKLQEDTGVKVTSAERGKIWAIRIRRGLQKERYHVINGQTGEILRPNRGEISIGNIPEAKDYFKYKIRNGENAKPLRRDEGRSYITYLGADGEIKEMKYINNGKKDDMLREERERYVADVNEVNILLQQTIEDYQKNATHENWLKVRDAMRQRIDVDRKYRIKERGFDNQKDLTIDTMEEAVEKSTHHCIDDEEDEYGPWSSHMRH